MYEEGLRLGLLQFQGWIQRGRVFGVDKTNAYRRHILLSSDLKSARTSGGT